MFKRRLAVTRTVVFVSTVCVCLVALGFWNNWTSRSVQLAQMGPSATKLSRAMAQQADDTIKQADTVLLGLVERAEHKDTSPETPARWQRLLQLHMAELPALDSLALYDDNGAPWVAAQATAPTGPGDAQRDALGFHRTHAGRGAHVGAPVPSRSGDRWSIPVSRRIDHADGRFAGVAVATLQVGFLQAFYDGLDIGSAGTLALVSEGGTVMALRPYDSRAVGRSMADTPLYGAYRTHGNGRADRSLGAVQTASLTSEPDGVTRLAAFQALATYPLFATAALSRDETLAAWRREALMRGAFILSLASLIGYGGWRLVVQLTLRTEAEAEVMRARDALETLNKTLRQFAMQDGLTGLANRRQFDLALGAAFERASQDGSSLALILMDVDCFKLFNDTYGHIVGDECLRTIGQTVAEFTPGQAGVLAARYGGEEIVLLLPDTDVAAAVVVAEAICQAIRGLAIVHSGNLGGFVTLSAGVDAAAPQAAGGAPADLVAAADKALYAAKAAGRDRVCVNAVSPHRPETQEILVLSGPALA